jgi:hypothetical protein
LYRAAIGLTTIAEVVPNLGLELRRYGPNS